ncbi:MAG: tetratricopeptide repeat protein, partial [Anaerolineales bacterium]|nr:tetratricopeptide repeat protein [Anaerolineales bacterium]
LLQAVGDFEGARPFLERAVAIWEAKLGPDHPHTKIGRNNLAALLNKTGRSQSKFRKFWRGLFSK